MKPTKCKIQSDMHMAVRGSMHFIFYIFPFFAILTKLFLKASFIAFNAMCTLQSYKSDDSISAKSISINDFSNEFVRGFLKFASPFFFQVWSVEKVTNYLLVERMYHCAVVMCLWDSKGCLISESLSLWLKSPKRGTKSLSWASSL